MRNWKKKVQKIRRKNKPKPMNIEGLISKEFWDSFSKDSEIMHFIFNGGRSSGKTKYHAAIKIKEIQNGKCS